MLLGCKPATLTVSMNASRVAKVLRAESMLNASGSAGWNAAASHSRRCAETASATRPAVGRSVAAALMEQLAPGGRALHRERVARYVMIAPVFPGRLTPSAGGAASEPAAIGRVAINCCVEYRSADSALQNLNYVYLREADMTPGTPAISPRTRRN